MKRGVVILDPLPYPFARRRCIECRTAFNVRVDRGGQQPITCGDECRRTRNRRVGRESSARRRRHAELEARRDISRALEEPFRDAHGEVMRVTPEDLVEIQNEVRAGRPGVVARMAARYGLYENTVREYARLGPPVPIRIGRHQAWWAARLRGGPPVQLTRWVGVQAAEVAAKPIDKRAANG